MARRCHRWAFSPGRWHQRTDAEDEDLKQLLHPGTDALDSQTHPRMRSDRNTRWKGRQGSETETLNKLQQRRLWKQSDYKHEERLHKMNIQTQGGQSHLNPCPLGNNKLDQVESDQGKEKKITEQNRKEQKRKEKKDEYWRSEREEEEEKKKERKEEERIKK